MTVINTGPRLLHCPTCLQLAEHHFDHDEVSGDGTLSWFKCVCGQLRALDFVARGLEPRVDDDASGDELWPLLELDVGGEG